MTPKQLRQKAWSNISSAIALLEAGQPDTASYMVGYAAEYVLKARCCTRRGWAEFPADRAEAKLRGAKEVITHDLNDLLKLSGHEHLKYRDMNHIDWEQAMNWSEQQRYTPAGSVTPEYAKAQIEVTQKLCNELVIYEVVEKLRDVEAETSLAFGPYRLFILAFSPFPGRQGWEVLMSAPWPRDGRAARIMEIGNKIRSVLDDDLWGIIRETIFIGPDNCLVRAFNSFISTTGGIVATSGNVIDCYRLPNSFVITSSWCEPPVAA